MYIHLSIVGKTNSGSKEPFLGKKKKERKKRKKKERKEKKRKKEREREREQERHWQREREKGREKRRSRIYLLMAHSVREWHRRMCAAPQAI